MTAVLVVDDSLTVRMHLEEAFSAAGFEPILAADVASARRALDARPFALAVLDVLLPDGDGLELLAEIKRSPQHAGTPVVLLSTEAEVQHRVRGLQIGADEYVGKPYDAAHVVARARELVRRRAGFVDPGVAARPVLVVDDSVTAREELRAELELAGFAVLTAGSGEEGLRLAAERLPRAIVVDGVMPGMDGATFIREIRADAALRTTPCILLTASGSVGELRALDAGADAYVRKDEDGNELVLARLQALLRVATSAPALVAAGALAPKRILVMGAEAAPLGAVAEPLREDGHDVVRAASAEEALALLAVDRVDAIVVEATRAPDQGAAACLRLRADGRWRHVPLLVLGARADPDAIVDALAWGADDYLPAASGPLVARARVNAQLRRSQFEDENRTREGYARSAAILETISDAFFAVGRDWRFVYVNHALEELVRVPRDALTGEVLWERCPFLARGGAGAGGAGARGREPGAGDVRVARPGRALDRDPRLPAPRRPHRLPARRDRAAAHAGGAGTPARHHRPRPADANLGGARLARRRAARRPALGAEPEGARTRLRGGRPDVPPRERPARLLEGAAREEGSRSRPGPPTSTRSAGRSSRR